MSLTLSGNIVTRVILAPVTIQRTVLQTEIGTARGAYQEALLDLLAHGTPENELPTRTEWLESLKQGLGVPPGGSAGQALLKSSNVSFNTRWVTLGSAAFADAEDLIAAAASDAASKANAAQSAAITAAASDATTKANSAQSAAIATASSDATTKASAAQSSAITAAASDATTKANAAQTAAESHADSAAATAQSSAITAAASDATTKANNAQSAAILAAASDATTKANAAQSAAIYAAASDATTKANSAQSAAISAASSDAAIKAAAAKSEAISTASSDATTKANAAQAAAASDATTKADAARDAAKEFASALVTGVAKPSDTVWDVSSNTYPNIGGRGVSGAPIKGDMYLLTGLGTLQGKTLSDGDWLVALVDSPGQTDAKWGCFETAFPYTPLNKADVVSDIAANEFTEGKVGWLNSMCAWVRSVVSTAVSGITSFPGFGTTGTTACAGNDSRLSNSRPASDVSTWAKEAAKPTYTYSEVGAQPAGSYESPLTFNNGVSRSVNSITLAYGTTTNTVCQGNDSRLSDSRPASDVSSWAKASTKPTYSYTEVGADMAGAAAAVTLESLGATTTGAAVARSATQGAARTNLGLGDSATKNVGTAAGTVCAGNDARLGVTNIKTVDTVRNNFAPSNITSATSDDPEIRISVNAYTTYYFEVFMITTSTTACGIRAAIALPSVVNAAAYGAGFNGSPSTSAPIGSQLVGLNLIQFFNGAYNVAAGGSYARGTFRTGATPGPVTLRWTQYASNSANATMHAGTYMTLIEAKL